MSVPRFVLEEPIDWALLVWYLSPEERWLLAVFCRALLRVRSQEATA
jgi:hypothetical protein